MAQQQTAKKVGTNLTEGPIFKLLLVFVGPIILANLIQQLYGMVDLMIIGIYMGNTGTVGVSTGGEMSDMVTPIATSFGAAAQIYIAQLLGAKDDKRMKEAIGTSISFMMLVSVVIMVLVIVFRVQILELLNCPEEAFDQAESYMVITAVGVPFIFGYNAVAGVLRGMGESKRPMVFIIVAALVNVVLDFLLVGPFHMESAGAAYATALSQLASFVAALVYMYKRREQFDFSLKPSYFAIKGEHLKVILSLGIPQAIRSTLVRLSMLYVNASVNAYGMTASATNSIGNKLQKFLEIYGQSFSQAASAMVAQNLGAKKPERAKKTVLYSFYCCMVIAAITVVIVLVWPREVFGIFSKDAAVLDMGVLYCDMLAVHLVLSAMTSSLQSMVIGCGNATLNFVIGILDGVVCKIGLSLILVYVFDMGVFGYFWGTGFSRLIPGLICLVYFLSGAWSKRKLLTEEA